MLFIVVFFIFIVCIVTYNFYFNQNVTPVKIKDYCWSFVQSSKREEFVKSIVSQRPVAAHMTITDNDPFIKIGKVNL